MDFVSELIMLKKKYQYLIDELSLLKKRESLGDSGHIESLAQCINRICSDKSNFDNGAYDHFRANSELKTHYMSDDHPINVARLMSEIIERLQYGMRGVVFYGMQAPFLWCKPVFNADADNFTAYEVRPSFLKDSVFDSLKEIADYFKSKGFVVEYERRKPMFAVQKNEELSGVFESTPLFTLKIEWGV